MQASREKELSALLKPQTTQLAKAKTDSQPKMSPKVESKRTIAPTDKVKTAPCRRGRPAPREAGHSDCERQSGEESLIVRRQTIRLSRSGGTTSVPLVRFTPPRRSRVTDPTGVKKPGPATARGTGAAAGGR